MNLNPEIKRVLIEETNQIIRVKPMFMYSQHNYKSRVWNPQTEHYLCESIDKIKLERPCEYGDITSVDEHTIITVHPRNTLLICHESVDRVKKYYKNEELLIFDRMTLREDYEF